jgi:hypothetical protein
MPLSARHSEHLSDECYLLLCGTERKQQGLQLVEPYVRRLTAYETGFTLPAGDDGL